MKFPFKIRVGLKMVSAFIQQRLTRLINSHPSTEKWHLFKDKLREKTVIAQLGCPTARLYKVFETPDELDLTFLPSSFVIKLTFQSCGRGVVLVKDGIDLRTQQPLDVEEIKQYLQLHLLPSGTSVTHQKVMVEELLEPEIAGSPLLDVKLFYFSGALLFLQIVDSSTRPENRVYPRFHYSPTWKRLPIHTQEAPLDQQVPKPQCLDEIIQWGDRIASTFFPNTFIRLDFYPTNKGVVFGETTLTPYFECTPATDLWLGKILKKKKIQ